VIDRLIEMGEHLWSSHGGRLLDWIDQQPRWKGFCQIRRATGCKSRCARRFAVVSRYENHRQRDPATSQSLAQLDAGTVSQIDVQYQTKGIVEISLALEGFGSIEKEDFEAMLSQKPPYAPEHAGIIVHDENGLRMRHGKCFLNKCSPTDFAAGDKP
jgi:hypothetical protein